MLNTLVFRLSKLKGSLWAIYNATDAKPVFRMGPPLEYSDYSGVSTVSRNTPSVNPPL